MPLLPKKSDTQKLLYFTKNALFELLKISPPHLYKKTSKQNCLARQWLIHQYPQFNATIYLSIIRDKFTLQLL